MHAKMSPSLHQHWCLHTFLLCNTHGDGDVGLSSMLPFRLELGLGLGVQEPQSLQVQGRWAWKMHVISFTALNQHCSLHTFLTWNIDCAGEQILSSTVS